MEPSSNSPAHPPSPHGAAANGSGETSLLERLAFATLAEQRSARRWRAATSLIWLAFFVAILLLVVGATSSRLDSASTEKHTALIELKGVISADSKASADKIIGSLRAAFRDKNTQGVVLRIDSPGGSPVQSGYINDEIKRLRSLHKDVPLHVVVQDICASGGYYVAVAADKIFVNKASIVGSVGVLMDGFGFTGTMDKLGVERRLVAAGSNKGFMDPFSPINPEQQKFAQQMVGEIHEQFIKVVRDGRGTRLKETPEMFSGLVWSGEKSVALGLADGIGGLEYVAREVIKAEQVVDFTPEDSLSEQFARRLGASASDSFWQSLSARLFAEHPRVSLR